MAENNDYILQLIRENHLVSDDQIAEGWATVAQSSSELSIIDALKQLGYLDEGKLLAILCEQYGLELVDLSDYEVPEAVASQLPSNLARQYKVVPIRVHDDILTIAMGDPTDMDTLDAIRVVLQRDVDAVVAPQEQIDRLLIQTYGTDEEKLDLVSDKLATTDDMQQITDGTEDGTLSMGQGSSAEDDAPIIKLVSQIIINAFNMKASDIHMEPMEKRYRIRFRIDGALREQEGPPKYLQPNITSRLKIMAHMDISEKRIPLDGRIQIKLKDKDIDLRVSSIPTTHGESIVMRILDKSSIQLDIPKLGFYSDDQEKINRIINYPDGIFLVTGPTGSGKTTSLYAFLNTINTPTRKIITVEDPVEYMLPGINQVQVNVAAKMTFEGDAASGAEHHHGRRDSRPGDGGNRHQRIADRASGVFDSAYERCAERGDPTGGYGSETVPCRLVGACGDGAASSPPGLQELRGANGCLAKRDPHAWTGR